MSARGSRPENLLGAVALAVTDRLRDAVTAEGERGLSASAALVHLRLRPGQSIDFLARVLRVTHPGAVRLVDRLEHDGLVERRAGADARSRALVLTDEGRQAAAAVLARRSDVLGELLAPLTAAERRQLEPLFEKLLVAVTGDRWSARHICRLCDFPACDSPACPVDRAASDPGIAHDRT
jgi:MarR family transcriptional repressor of emrRAB